VSESSFGAGARPASCGEDGSQETSLCPTHTRPNAWAHHDGRIRRVNGFVQRCFSSFGRIVGNAAS
jgi:hypothetical protein